MSFKSGFDSTQRTQQTHESAQLMQRTQLAQKIQQMNLTQRRDARM